MSDMRKVGPWHVHWPEEDGFPGVMDPRVWPATFLVEFGKPGEDYGGFMVCGCSGYPRERDDGTTETYEPAACACLIAAAPELLEACKRARELCEELEHRDSVSLAGTGELFPITLPMLNAAIAKAEPAP